MAWHRQFKMLESEHTMTEHINKYDSEIDLETEFFNRQFDIEFQNRARKKLLSVSLAKPQTKPRKPRKNKLHSGIPQTLNRHCVAVEAMAHWQRGKSAEQIANELSYTNYGNAMSNEDIFNVFKKYNYKYFGTVNSIAKKREHWRTVQDPKYYIETIRNSMRRYGDEVIKNLLALGLIS